MKHFLLLLWVFFPGFASAGYYVQGQNLNNTHFGPTGCYLVPSMAIGQLVLGAIGQLSVITSMVQGDGDTGTFSAQQATSPYLNTHFFTGTWAGCSVQAAGAVIPGTTGGLVDPVIASGNLGGGSGASGGGSVDLTFPDVFQISTSDGVLVAVAVAGLWAVGFAFSALKKALSVDDV